jgi:hypothetical protein
LSPEASRRENWWYYSQSGPGVYRQRHPGRPLPPDERHGHFPMIENYPAFREHLLPELEFMAA